MNIKKIDFKEAKSLIKDGAILVDVRTQEEYDEKHIEGSLLITLSELEDTVSNKIKNKEEKVIVYCQSGKRSSKAASLLISMGYAYVFDLGSIENCEL